MKKRKVTPKDKRANMQNPNKGSDGKNKQYDKAQGNRGEQMNPNRKNESDKKKTPNRKKQS